MEEQITDEQPETENIHDEEEDKEEKDKETIMEMVVEQEEEILRETDEKADAALSSPENSPTPRTITDEQLQIIVYEGALLNH